MLPSAMPMLPTTAITLPLPCCCTAITLTIALLLPPATPATTLLRPCYDPATTLLLPLLLPLQITPAITLLLTPCHFTPANYPAITLLPQPATDLLPCYYPHALTLLLPPATLRVP